MIRFEAWYDTFKRSNNHVGEMLARHAWNAALRSAMNTIHEKTALQEENIKDEVEPEIQKLYAN